MKKNWEFQGKNFRLSFNYSRIFEPSIKQIQKKREWLSEKSTELHSLKRSLKIEMRKKENKIYKNADNSNQYK